MATYTPPPYFPQGQLTPGDPKRYRKFKFIIAAAVVLLLLLVGGVAVGVFYLLRALF